MVHYYYYYFLPLLRASFEAPLWNDNSTFRHVCCCCCCCVVSTFFIVLLFYHFCVCVFFYIYTYTDDENTHSIYALHLATVKFSAFKFHNPESNRQRHGRLPPPPPPPPSPPTRGTYCSRRISTMALIGFGRSKALRRFDDDDDVDDTRRLRWVRHELSCWTTVVLGEYRRGFLICFCSPHTHTSIAVKFNWVEMYCWCRSFAVDLTIIIKYGRENQRRRLPSGTRRPDGGLRKGRAVEDQC